MPPSSVIWRPDMTVLASAGPVNHCWRPLSFTYHSHNGVFDTVTYPAERQIGSYQVWQSRETLSMDSGLVLGFDMATGEVLIGRVECDDSGRPLEHLGLDQGKRPCDVGMHARLHGELLSLTAWRWPQDGPYSHGPVSGLPDRGRIVLTCVYRDADADDIPL